jgi:hypothetical protein
MRKILTILLIFMPLTSEASEFYSQTSYGVAISESEINSVEEASGTRFDLAVFKKNDEVFLGFKSAINVLEGDSSERDRFSAGPAVGISFEKFNFFGYLSYYKESLRRAGHADVLARGTLAGAMLERSHRINKVTEFTWASFLEASSSTDAHYADVSSKGLLRPSLNSKPLGLTRGVLFSLRISL